MAERISFQTQDGVTIIGDWSPAPTMIGAVLLVHMMPETRESWSLMSRELVKRGLGAFAIDLRGHGESRRTEEGDELEYRDFGDDEHAGYIFDVMGGIDWLKGRGIELSRIGLCGASIGANLSVRMLTEEPGLPGAVLLSPGADYHGFNALEDAQNLLPDQSIVIVSSEDDAESFTPSRTMYEQAPVETKAFFPYKSSGHGTLMLASDKGLTTKLADWLANLIKGA